MTNKWSIQIPETPSPNYILVKNISSKSTEQTVREFFLFCGKIKEFELKSDDEDNKYQIALIHFERESAAKTASLLSNALLDDSHIMALPYFDISSSDDENGIDSEHLETQESKPKSRIAAEILANGYILQDHVVAKGIEYDNKYNLSSRLTSFLNALQTNVKHFEEKYRIWDNVINIDRKYKLSEKAQTAAQTAQNRAQVALQTPTGQKVHEFASQTLAQIAAVHYEAKKIQSERLNNNNNGASNDTSENPIATPA
ncbi:hypothetical protein G6F57_010362 [Rhizopus arrhizus]|uniref:RRM domain-containing protein n=1 Tax=Rhizopus oryzae TaxID=64495 RepID=A0A9P6X1R9_RHIOR|nr:hypothetical protein G6F23_006266 [Rhizopus arrhizus]KAG0759957.1 hypothetical protein G6F24_008682 [Rhizopus arrhizus]KAG0783994.1 hypothetical protein G6F21_010189 [Rhizopus arrhizus]KAG0808073.1 hypothetical protein G6F20_009871 [Rhizopus arrhizus]KAG0825363.1 hypothetical protein G6F19_009853 [Rhizopus arrhizus]